MLTAALLGFALGLRHACDPDHLIAVSTLAARHRGAWAASWIGASWGLGHSITLFSVGFAIIALQLPVPQTLAQAMELAVGCMLVALGVANLASASRSRGLTGAREREGDDTGARRRADRGVTLSGALSRSAVVGLTHGLAGSAAVALLAMTAAPTPDAALLYLALFSLGSVGGMVAFSICLAAPLSRLCVAPARRRMATLCTGALSLAFGAAVVYEITFVQGWPAV